MVFGALCYIIKMLYHQDETNRQPIVYPHNCPPVTRERNKRGNSINHTACTHDQRRRPQQNDERFCQTVGVVKKTKIVDFRRRFIAMPS